IMREESRYKADIKSSASAVGLMQVMPATARWLAPKLNIKQREIDLTNADQNIHFGVYFLSYLQTLVSDKELIAAGYNAGQGRAKRWKYEYKKYPSKTRYEMLPIEETRHYIRKVMQSYYVYSYLLAAEDKS
ncbi:MAG: transglycosylase SLT domain-containing protein, partial [Spirochaetales bacterium]|nr:transglycosylase SLT domain-containing protein [Spirochaetales bacterium]